jgi:hypothetical protein
MRIRLTRQLCALLTVALISLPSAVFAQDDAGMIESIDGEGTMAPESKSLGTLEDYQWAPVGLGRTFDTIMVRPIAIAMMGLSAITYCVAIIAPSIRGDRERMGELYQGMLVEPFKYAILRPPFTAPDHFVLLQEEREAEEALAQEALDNARLDAEANAAAEKAKRAKAEAEAAALEMGSGTPPQAGDAPPQ